VDLPPIILLYGIDGVGKSTFASKAPKPYFIDPEEGSLQLDVARMTGIETSTEVKEKIKSLTADAKGYKTLVVDTYDFLQDLVAKEICQKSGASSLAKASGGFGAGMQVQYSEFVEFKNLLFDLRKKQKMNIILLAHCAVSEFNDPAVETAYHRYEVNLFEGKNGANSVRALTRQMCDMVLFANYKTYVKGDGKEARGISDRERVLYTERDAAYDAKNRYNLPQELAFDWHVLMSAMKKAKPKTATELRDAIAVMVKRLPKKEDQENTMAQVEKVNGDIDSLRKIANNVHMILKEK
jgi:hypothetical protein